MIYQTNNLSCFNKGKYFSRLHAAFMIDPLICNHPCFGPTGSGFSVYHRQGAFFVGHSDLFLIPFPQPMRSIVVFPPQYSARTMTTRFFYFPSRARALVLLILWSLTTAGTCFS